MKIPIPSFTILDQHQSISNLFEGENDRLNTTSADHLFIHATKQKSFGSDTSSANHSTSVSDRHFRSPEVITDDKDRKQFQSSPSSSSEEQLPAPPNTEAKESNSKVQATFIDRNLSSSHVQLHQIDTQENQPFNEIRSTYDDMSVHKSIVLDGIQYSMTFHFRTNFWRHLLERFFHFMLPITQNTDHNLDFSHSTITSNTQSWSTMIPSSTLHTTQSDSIGPWWSRRDVYDQSPATFIFANESLRISHSIESITSSQQMCISIDNMPCYFNCYSYSNRCHCCCSSSTS